MWRVEFLNVRVVAEMEAQPDDIRAKFLRIVDIIRVKGLHQVREPYVKHLQGSLWEMRMKGKEGSQGRFMSLLQASEWS